MHYWTVPRLGSFIAVPLVYKSCLNIESFDQAVIDWQEYQQKLDEQKEEKEKF
jgi:predicted  nucleic acid-binding Zn ribbon protein